MNSFIRQVKIKRKTILFRFSKMHTPAGLRYQVNLLSEVPVYFQMEKKERGWRLINAPKVPDWIQALEGELSNAIEENKGEPE